MKNTRHSSQEIRKDVLDAVRVAIKAADPKFIMRENLKLSGAALIVRQTEFFDLGKYERIFVIGGGKASAFMAEEVEEILGDKITAGYVNVPDYLKPKPKLQYIKLHSASHPIPDKEGTEGVRKMLALTQKPRKNDLVICLISGGASALMPLPAQGITLANKQKITSLLLKSGANITEINTVRKHLSGIKGGNLAKQVYPATVLSLIISDVVGDEIGFIASGPTVPDPTTFKDAKSVLEKFRLWKKVPMDVKKHIESGISGKIEETPKPGDPIFENVHNVVVGSNKFACLAVREHFRKSGYDSIVLSTRIQGEARQVGRIFAGILRDVRENGFPFKAPLALICGGETTVTIRGKGVGGRNQEAVLAAAISLEGLRDACFASFGTDGVDGPTKAAGAISDGDTLKRAMGMDAGAFLENNDSYTFFKKTDDLIVTGPTGTNVNDIMVSVAG